jgi:hypothetical protein
MNTLIRLRRDTVCTLHLRDAQFADLAGAAPWRQFRWHKKQVHYPGQYWSSTMQAHVGYESRLELAALLLEDFDPDVRWIGSQPFEMEAQVGAAKRKHVPDYLVQRSDNTVDIVDVKPHRMLQRPEVAEALAWPAAEFAHRGWQYRIISEPEPVALANARFLAGYRRASQFVEFDLVDLTQAVRGAFTLGGAMRRATGCIGDPATARAVVLHLLWTRRLHCDLGAGPLSTATLLTAA